MKVGTKQRGVNSRPHFTAHPHRCLLGDRPLPLVSLHVAFARSPLAVHCSQGCASYWSSKIALELGRLDPQPRPTRSCLPSSPETRPSWPPCALCYFNRVAPCWPSPFLSLFGSFVVALFALLHARYYLLLHNVYATRNLGRPPVASPDHVSLRCVFILPCQAKHATPRILHR